MPRFPQTTHSLLCALGVLAFGTPSARAQYGARAEVERPAASTHGEDPTAAGTELSTESVAADETLGTLLLQAPGIHVARSGGLGSFTALSLRGGEFGHTSVLLGDIPLQGVDAGPIDLTTLPIAAFSHVEIFRGGAPAWFDAAALGGVLRLRPHAAERSTAGAGVGVGSFGTARVDALVDLRRARTRLSARVGLEGSRGDFAYRDDNATALDPTDDRDRLRANADTRGAHGSVSLVRDTPNGRVHAVVLATSRSGGEPGAGATHALHARRSQTRIFGAVSHVAELGAHQLQLVLGGAELRRQLDDRRGEIGFGQEYTDDRLDAGFLRAGLRLRAARVLELTAIANARVDTYRPHDALGPQEVDVVRTTVSGTVETRLHGRVRHTRMELRSSARIESSQTSASETVSVNAPTFRAAGLIAPRPWLSLSTSIARGRRVPTLLELFGDRGALVASPDLTPETGRLIDAGVVLRGRRGDLSASLELRAFEHRSEDLIRYIPTSQYTAAARNLADARIRGVEFGTRGRWGRHLDWAVAWTGMRTDDGAGRELNWRPRRRVHLQPTVHTRRFGLVRDLAVFVAIHHRAGFYNDPANFVRVEATTWTDAGVRLVHDTGLVFALTVRDLFDQGGRDFVGYPLPGRRFAARIHYQKDFD